MMIYAYFIGYSINYQDKEKFNLNFFDPLFFFIIAHGVSLSTIGGVF